jgi:hypothetical protein
MERNSGNTTRATPRIYMEKSLLMSVPVPLVCSESGMLEVDALVPEVRTDLGIYPSVVESDREH